MIEQMNSQKKIDQLTLNSITEKEILDKVVEVANHKQEPCYCVDGRTGPRHNKNNDPLPNTPYTQALGGDLNIASIRWLLNKGQNNYLDIITQTFTDLSQAGYKKLGVHYGGHAHGEGSDCGFADNNHLIMQTLIKNTEEIWQIISQATSQYPELKLNQKRYQELILNFVSRANLQKIPSGKKIIDHSATLPQVTVQNLKGDHREIAAVVNLKPNTTLDTDDNQGKNQAFNLDLWRVQEQAKDLKINDEDATLLTLGLYVATEMVLVEQKKGVRLPILINE